VELFHLRPSVTNGYEKELDTDNKVLNYLKITDF